eukprot:7073931-Karenia_brevis.AAC.1
MNCLSGLFHARRPSQNQRCLSEISVNRRPLVHDVHGDQKKCAADAGNAIPGDAVCESDIEGT